MKENPLIKLRSFGQSVWLDFLRRGMLGGGELARLIADDGVAGVTSNPAIFEKAIAGSHDYDEDVRLRAVEGRSPEEVLHALMIRDIQLTADLFADLYRGSRGSDGYVSLEVSPLLAHDTEATVREARRLWAAVDRPNIFIKVPATSEGVPAITRLAAEGINVNVTLLFGLARYREVAEAYITGLEQRRARGASLDRLSSVASFFLSRIDSLVDPMLEKRIREGGQGSALATRLHGQVAISSAKVASAMFREIFSSDRFRALEQQGAAVQRLLWASTGTKNPAYPDTRYIEPLIGEQTITTVPQETLNAYRDHGDPKPRLGEGVVEAREILERVGELGIDLEAVSRTLEDQGVEKFDSAWSRLLDSLRKRIAAALGEVIDRQTIEAPGLESSVAERVAGLAGMQFASRFWRKDASLWTAQPKAAEQVRASMDWLDVAGKMEEALGGIEEFVSEVKEAGFRHVVHLGMGGSSLAPMVFEKTFPPVPSGLPLTVLDTTDPEQILAVGKVVPVARTLFIIASKSGTTSEPLALGDYFFERVKLLTAGKAGDHFVAITDPNTLLARMARERAYRRAFLGFPGIGGRFSALSYFGLVPAALLGVDVRELLELAMRMVHACSSCLPEPENPGIRLGAALGELASRGRDKVTLVVPEAIATLGMWLEQLLAESTGKDGRGILPVAGEQLGDPSAYGSDRVFVRFRLPGDGGGEIDERLAGVQAQGHPVITARMDSPLDLGQEFFRWEMATATAASILGVNPFDQPNVQEAKDAGNAFLELMRKRGRIAEREPGLRDGNLTFHGAGSTGDAASALRAFFAKAKPGDYIGLLSFLTENPELERHLQSIRLLLRDRLRLATTLGWGPRYLHSTGQYHKGGPNTGLFLLLTGDERSDVSIPGQPYSFGSFRMAQALGDMDVLRRHGRRVLRVHLDLDASGGLERLREMIARAVEGL